MKPITFQYYPGEITASKPLGDITLDRFLSSTQYPKKKISDTFSAIQKAQEAGDMATKNTLKTSLYSFTPCVYVKDSRKYENIVNWTGLMALDFDKLPSVIYAKEWKNELFNENKWVISAWLSPSRYGVRALVKIPVVHSVGEFKEHFHALQNELSVYRGWDRAPQNCILPMFLSYDPELLRREDYSTWTGRYTPPVPPPIKQYIITDKSNQVKAIIESAINRIVSDGHPQLRAAAYSLGGYCGAGYIDSGFALQMLENMIDRNAYLSQKARVYKGTAKTMINKGMLQPLFLK